MAQQRPAREVEHVEGNHVGSIVRQLLSKFDSNHVYPLFAARNLGFLTSLLAILWGESRVDYKSVVNG